MSSGFSQEIISSEKSLSARMSRGGGGLQDLHYKRTKNQLQHKPGTPENWVQMPHNLMFSTNLPPPSQLTENSSF